MVGAMLSATVTVEVQEALLPLPSLTDTVTVLFPMLAQVNEPGVTETIFTVPQLSVAVWITLPEVMVTVPAEFKNAVKFLQIRFGGVISFKVTDNVQVLVLPALSVAVRVTIWVMLLPDNTRPLAGLWVTAGLAVQLSLRDVGV